MAQIDVAPAKGLSGFLTYNKLPRLLYAGAKGFAPPLDVERWTLHGHFLNPHFKLVEAQEFLAKRDGQWVGRIFAQVYKPEVMPGRRVALPVRLARRSGRHRGRARIDARGRRTGSRRAAPIESTAPSLRPSTANAGCSSRALKSTPMFLTPWHPPYLSRHIEALGYEKAKDLVSYMIDLTPEELNKPSRILDRAEWKDRLKIRELDFKRLKQGETQLMSDLFNDGWRDNWGFVPFTKAEFEFDRRRARLRHAA